jgi:hypothetical protein
MYTYLMKTNDGNKYPTSFSYPVNKGDEVVYKGIRYCVSVVCHYADGSGSTIECNKI